VTGAKVAKGDLVPVDGPRGVRWARPAARGGRRRDQRPVVAALEARPTCPRSLGQAGKRAFEVVSKERWPTLTAAEVPILARYSGLHDLLETARRSLEADGFLVQGSRGQPVENPAVALLMTIHHELRQLERVLGLGPASRVRLQIEILQAERLGEKGERRRAASNGVPPARDPRIRHAIDAEDD